jgi:hypothetical protein
MMRIDVHIHNGDDGTDLKELLTMVRALVAQEKRMAADITSVKGLVAAINDETNVVAQKVDAQTAKIAELQAKVEAGGGVTAADLQELQDGLQPISDRLTALGANPTDPIPA